MCILLLFVAGSLSLWECMCGLLKVIHFHCQAGLFDWLHGLNGWWLYLALQWIPTLIGLWWTIHLCILWDPVQRMGMECHQTDWQDHLHVKTMCGLVDVKAMSGTVEANISPSRQSNKLAIAPTRMDAYLLFFFIFLPSVVSASRHKSTMSYLTCQFYAHTVDNNNNNNNNNEL